jgi:hypothetical protein
MPTTEMIVMVAVAAAVTLAFIHLLRLIGTALLHRTLRKAVEQDPTNAGAVLAQLGKAAPDTSDGRLSTILIALGIAMIAASVVIGDPRWMHYGVAGALFPLIVGTALWLRLFLIERARRLGSQQ